MLPDLDACIAYLFTAYRQRPNEAVVAVYQHQLADVPLAILRAAVLALPGRQSFFPSVHEIKVACELARLDRVKDLVWTACEVCRETRPGWDVVVDPAGVKRLARCACWQAHQARVAAAGIPLRPIVALLEAAGDEP